MRSWLAGHRHRGRDDMNLEERLAGLESVAVAQATSRTACWLTKVP